MEHKESEICIYGGEDFLLGFRLVGIKKIFFEKEKASENLATIKEVMSNPNHGVLIIQEEAYNRLPTYTQIDLLKSVKPVTVILSKESGMNRLREMIIKSIGVDLCGQPE